MSLLNAPRLHLLHVLPFLHQQIIVLETESTVTRCLGVKVGQRLECVVEAGRGSLEFEERGWEEVVVEWWSAMNQ